MNQPVNARDITWHLRDIGLYDAGLCTGQPVAGFTVDQIDETRATVHYLGAEPERAQARLERAAATLEGHGYSVQRVVDADRYYLDVTRLGKGADAA